MAKTERPALAIEARIRTLAEDEDREQAVKDILSDIDRQCSNRERERLMQLLVWQLVEG